MSIVETDGRCIISECSRLELAAIREFMASRCEILANHYEA